MTTPKGDRGGGQTPDSSWDADEQEYDDDGLGSDSVDTTAEIECPHCGESMALNLDLGGGRSQDYVEDCQVCCRPCRIRLQYDDQGQAVVWVDQTH